MEDRLFRHTDLNQTGVYLRLTDPSYPGHLELNVDNLSQYAGQWLPVTSGPYIGFEFFIVGWHSAYWNGATCPIQREVLTDREKIYMWQTYLDRAVVYGLPVDPHIYYGILSEPRSTGMVSAPEPTWGDLAKRWLGIPTPQTEVAVAQQSFQPALLPRLLHVTELNQKQNVSKTKPYPQVLKLRGVRPAPQGALDS